MTALLPESAAFVWVVLAVNMEGGGGGEWINSPTVVSAGSLEEAEAVISPAPFVLVW